MFAISNNALYCSVHAQNHEILRPNGRSSVARALASHTGGPSLDIRGRPSWLRFYQGYQTFWNVLHSLMTR